MSKYTSLQRRLARGWNTWDTHSVLAHVLLPQGFCLRLRLKDPAAGALLGDVNIGRKGPHGEAATPGIRSYDGSYTDLLVEWRGVRARIESGLADGGGLVLLATPLSRHIRAPSLVVEAGFLWNRPGAAGRTPAGFAVRGPDIDMAVHAWASAGVSEDPSLPLAAPYLVLPLDAPAVVSAGEPMDAAAARRVLDARRAELELARTRYTELKDPYEAIQTCVAWDTVFDPIGARVATTASRAWNVASGGWMLSGWDTYFAACLAAVDNRDLAYANLYAITREARPEGFVPGASAACGYVSRDRSLPPVGALAAKLLFLRFGDAWPVQELFDTLLRWNRWWPERRGAGGLLLAWGSNPFTPVVGHPGETDGVGAAFGAAKESGMDNSPMYDDIPFDPGAGRLLLADAGLMGLYAWDCQLLSELAVAIGRADAAGELRARGEACRSALERLWDEQSGVYRNLRLDTGQFSPRLSPTCFYPLLCGAPGEERARRLVREHLLNDAEFWGDWPLPSISRSDPAFPEQNYWRGRVWAPMNFLVYLGLRRYPSLAEPRAMLAEKSKELLLREWRGRGHVHENYSAITGDGCDAPNSDPFYHWGGLLGLPALMEQGLLPGPEEPCD